MLKRITHFVKKTDSCWIWLGSLDEWGYGRVRINGKRIFAHRYFYEYYNGVIPEGLIIRHTCDKPFCVNPEHLITGTHQDNANDCIERGRKVTAPRERNGRTKITSEQVDVIKTRDGESPTAVAREYGVSQSLIRKIWGRWEAESGKDRYAKYKYIRTNTYDYGTYKARQKAKEKERAECAGLKYGAK